MCTRAQLGPGPWWMQMWNSSAGKSICHKGRGVNAGRSSPSRFTDSPTPLSLAQLPNSSAPEERPGERGTFSKALPSWNPHQNNINSFSPRSVSFRNSYGARSVFRGTTLGFVPHAGTLNLNSGLSDLNLRWR